MSSIMLVTGGCRSGKSRYALARAMVYQRRAFVATAVAFDEEMADRIAKHQAERGAEFETFEAPYDLAATVAALPAATEVAVIDCLTVWTGNLMYKYGDDEGMQPTIDAFLKVLESPPCDLVLVTNEVGLGIVPENAMARRFRDVAGFLNQQVARRADHVVLMVCGCPIHAKGELLP